MTNAFNMSYHLFTKYKAIQKLNSKVQCSLICSAEEPEHF